MYYILNKKSFDMRLRELGFQSVVDFAKRTRIHRNTLNLYLRGKSVLSSSFERIAKALQVDPLEIITPMSDSKTKIEAIGEIRPVVALIVKHDPKIAAILLGSRAKGKMRPYADWDIGVTRLSKPIGGDEYLRLRSIVGDFAEDMLRRVDIINLDAAPQWFLEGIDYEPIMLDGDRESFVHFQGVLHGIGKKAAA